MLGQITKIPGLENGCSLFIACSLLACTQIHISKDECKNWFVIEADWHSRMTVVPFTMHNAVIYWVCLNETHQHTAIKAFDSVPGVKVYEQGI